MKIDDTLYQAAVSLLEEHPDTAVAACYLEDGQILTGVATESQNGAAQLCAEAGLVCEAQKLKKKIVASICVSDSNTLQKRVINTPCGICQERLMWFGGDMQVAVPQESDPTKWESVTLKDVQPHWWYAIRQK